jgi:uncharacterized cupredoxin-like copper-binding protein
MKRGRGFGGWAASALVALLVGGAAVAVSFGVDHRAGAEAPTTLGPGLVTVHVQIHYSHFSLSELHVKPGTTVRFVIENHDPINHEFIVGPPAVHARHERGNHPAHPPVPGEVTVRADDFGLTFYRFDQPGRVLFACHLPGHFAYGMRGWVVVE